MSSYPFCYGKGYGMSRRDVELQENSQYASKLISMAEGESYSDEEKRTILLYPWVKKIFPVVFVMEKQNTIRILEEVKKIMPIKEYMADTSSFHELILNFNKRENPMEEKFDLEEFLDLYPEIATYPDPEGKNLIQTAVDIRENKRCNEALFIVAKRYPKYFFVGDDGERPLDILSRKFSQEVKDVIADILYDYLDKSFQDEEDIEMFDLSHEDTIIHDVIEGPLKSQTDLLHWRLDKEIFIKLGKIKN